MVKDVVFTKAWNANMSSLSLLDPSITFLSQPTILSGKNPNTSMNIILGGCIYDSEFEVESLYWVKDNETVSTTQSHSLSHLPNGYDFPNFTVANAKITDRGQYQCVVEYRGTTYRSEKLYLDFQGIISLTFFQFDSIFYKCYFTSMYYTNL